MPHALELFSNAYKRIDPVFSKRSRRLLRSLDRCKAAASKAADTGQLGNDLFVGLREFQKDHKSFVEAYNSRSQELFFVEVEQMLADLVQMDRIMKLIPEALLGENREAMVTVVSTLVQQ